MRIKIYGADWCSDCVVAKKFLTEKGISFEYILTDNKSAIAFVEKINKGKRVIPTIVINNNVYSNPGLKRLSELLLQCRKKNKI